MVKSEGRLSKPLFGGMGFIFCFHRVLPNDKKSSLFGSKGMSVSPEYLDWLCTFLMKKKLDLISMDEAQLRIKSRKQKRKFVVLTFDDGYADNLEFGLPIFEKHQVPFTIYVSLNLPEGTMIRWWDMLEKRILENDTIELQFPNEIISFKIITQEEKVSAWWRIRTEIIKREHHISRKQLLDLFGENELTSSEFTNSVALTFDQIKGAAVHPLITIGAHTLHHKPLKTLPTEEANFEIVESKRKLELICGKPIEHFAYPYGSLQECSVREFELVKNAGFKTGVTFMPGNIQANNSIYSLPRYAGGDYVSEQEVNYLINGVKHFSENY
jgi:peptidoglycan/xylan/chitin deacetylase (PgdA/CDA1 family)